MTKPDDASEPIRVALKDLRQTLLKLKPTGSTGFEGLLAAIFSEITNQDFRLAKSGLQFGRDGETSQSENHITFEAKLYNGRINDKDVQSKITQLIGSTDVPDIWVLGATAEIGSQSSTIIENAAKRSGLGILILDWPEASSAPPLALICARASKSTVGFLRQHMSDQNLVELADDALKVIRSQSGFSQKSEKLIYKIQDPSLAAGNAIAANTRWLSAMIEDPCASRAVFGQSFSPRQSSKLGIQPRSSLICRVQKHLVSVPQDSMIALLGEEGAGKSWAFMQSWRNLSSRPLAIIIPAAAMTTVTAYSQVEDFLIGKLIEHTGGNDDDLARNRWKRRLDLWRNSPNESRPRFVVYIDGLNQNPGYDWPRWLDGVFSMINECGGLLIFSSRTFYFNDRIQRSLSTQTTAIEVPNWSAEELSEIFGSLGIDNAQINPKVREPLQNPRILSIACELLGESKIENLSELSIDRLLFEHIRLSEAAGTALDTAVVFSKRLADHAREILDRANSQDPDHSIFEINYESTAQHTLNQDLLAVAEGQFFHPLDGDSALYTLSESGLVLALGISIIKSMRKAEHSDRDVANELAELLDPIAALDKTAESVFSGLVISSIDEDCSDDIRKALMISFLRLQNVDSTGYPIFVAAVRNTTAVAMDALYEIDKDTVHSANKDWVVSGLRACRNEPECWQIISEKVSNWLRHYTLDPAISIFRQASETEEKVAEERTKKAQELDDKFQSLSRTERNFLDSEMHLCDELDPAQLTSDAFKLVAGMPLAPFSTGLVACSFSRTLNSSHYVPLAEFSALLQYNQRDWKDTRLAIERASNFLADENTSTVGKWALVGLLYTSGGLEDFKIAKRLVGELTADRPHFPAWRLIEKYCASDPCDPGSVKPNNIDKTAAEYEKLDVTQNFKGIEDHFFRDALPGLARFRPEIAIAVRQNHAAAVASKDAVDLKMELYSTEQDSAIIDAPTVQTLLGIACRLSAPCDPLTSNNNDDWFVSQIAMKIAFPHKCGDEQLQFISDLPPHGPMILSLEHVFKPASRETLRQALVRAAESEDLYRQMAVLMFAENSVDAFTDSSIEALKELITSDDSLVRALAIGIACRLENLSLVIGAINDGWRANQLNSRENLYEIWHGSLAVLFAAERGALQPCEAVERISPRFFDRAASKLDDEASDEICRRLIVLIQRASGQLVPFLPPRVQKNFDHLIPKDPPLPSLDDPDEILGPDAFYTRMSETPEEYRERQKTAWDSFNDFGDRLSPEAASLVLEEVTFGAFDTLASAQPSKATELASFLLSLTPERHPFVRNSAIMLAKSISEIEPELSKELFDCYSDSHSFVNLTFGISSLPLESLCIWKSSTSPVLDELRTQRLDEATTDFHISQEVIAALQSERGDFLAQYVKDNIGALQPSRVARALMVAGFSLDSAISNRIIGEHEADPGLIGMAAKSARFAYDRNQWARHWFDKMCSSCSNEEFWRYSVLFLKIVDARFDLWGPNIQRKLDPVKNFEASLQDKIKARIKAWKTKREKTLCGDEAPIEVYIVLD